MLGFVVEEGYVVDVVVVVLVVAVDDDVDGVVEHHDGVVGPHYFEGLEPVDLVVELVVGVFLVDLDLVEGALVEEAFLEVEVFLLADKASFEAVEYHYLVELEFVVSVDQQLQLHLER